MAAQSEQRGLRALRVSVPEHVFTSTTSLSPGTEQTRADETPEQSRCASPSTSLCGSQFDSATSRPPSPPSPSDTTIALNSPTSQLIRSIMAHQSFHSTATRSSSSTEAASTISLPTGLLDIELRYITRFVRLEGSDQTDLTFKSYWLTFSTETTLTDVKDFLVSQDNDIDPETALSYFPNGNFLSTVLSDIDGEKQTSTSLYDQLTRTYLHAEVMKSRQTGHRLPRLIIRKARGKQDLSPKHIRDTHRRAMYRAYKLDVFEEEEFKKLWQEQPILSSGGLGPSEEPNPSLSQLFRRSLDELLQRDHAARNCLLCLHELAISSAAIEDVLSSILTFRKWRASATSAQSLIYRRGIVTLRDLLMAVRILCMDMLGDALYSYGIYTRTATFDINALFVWGVILERKDEGNVRHTRSAPATPMLSKEPSRVSLASSEMTRNEEVKHRRNIISIEYTDAAEVPIDWQPNISMVDTLTQWWVSDVLAKRVESQEAMFHRFMSKFGGRAQSTEGLKAAHQKAESAQQKMEERRDSANDHPDDSSTSSDDSSSTVKATVRASVLRTLNARLGQATTGSRFTLD